MELIFSVMTPKVMTQYLGALCIQRVILHRGSVDFGAVENGNGAEDSTCCTRCDVFSCEDLNDNVCQELMCSEKGC